FNIFSEKGGNRNDSVYQRTRDDILGLFMRPKDSPLSTLTDRERNSPSFLKVGITETVHTIPSQGSCNTEYQQEVA
ncbi:hypothetical protein J6590_095742, partial [Homalodisca vitripennis]